MVKVIGLKQHIANVRKIAGPEMEREVTAALFAGGNRVQTTAQKLITDGAVSGKNHIPSRPGEPPNNDTGVLKNNIETFIVKPLLVEVRSMAPYAAHLELGTSQMAERPYMRPAAKMESKTVAQFVRAAIAKIVKR